MSQLMLYIFHIRISFHKYHYITEWEYGEDEYGTYKKRINEFGLPEECTLSRTQKWYDENPPEPEVLPEPSEPEMMMDYLVDVDYRVTMIELGL
ncbi:hypothetical protein [Psychrobacillus sp.]|uniref:hypothetical protein n=1 Tax=Psychrobacillus sp. TaxID=1871623 RepID=UPI0028BEF33F|nr:hypothetical protein [Psychrobacillus sp.]